MSDVNKIGMARLLWEDDCTLPAIPKPYWRQVRRLCSVLADIFVRPLRGEKLTVLSEVAIHRTTRLAATIRALWRVCCWLILMRCIEFLSPSGHRLRSAAHLYDRGKSEETPRRGGDKFCFLVDARRNRPPTKDAA